MPGAGVALDRDSPHLPRPAPIDAYGGGGFRFAGMSHRGSLLCLPSGIWPVPIESPEAIDDATLSLVMEEAPPVELLLIGTGTAHWVMPEALRAAFRDRNVTVETMATGPAVRTYNILLGESRRVAALLIAVT